MIVRVKGGYEVRSEDGRKRLGGPYASREKALKRLRQVEYFKRRQRDPKPQHESARPPSRKERLAIERRIDRAYDDLGFDTAKSYIGQHRRLRVGDYTNHLYAYYSPYKEYAPYRPGGSRHNPNIWREIYTNADERT